MSVLGRLRSKPDPEKERQLREGMENTHLSWKDKFAMVFSAYVVLLLPAILVIVGFGLLVLWIFGAI